MASRAPRPAPAAPADHPAFAVPPTADLDLVREVAAGCRACDLWANATQTVFGEGRPRASLMLLGEQPGDKEDLAGEPFVGPAGQILDDALEQAGIDRERVFVTNVVKHFKWRPSGKRRLHERPNPAEIRACRPWLDLELQLVRPDVLVMMGATAAQAILGPAFRVSEGHGALLPPLAEPGPRLLATYHPSSILRSRSSEDREAGLRMLVEDLTVARQAIAG
ncbi:MAG TPA: UdgX family uracil-DNA binding protein [Candidatus Limnocylindrales bacterium]